MFKSSGRGVGGGVWVTRSFSVLIKGCFGVLQVISGLRGFRTFEVACWVVTVLLCFTLVWLG